MQYMDDIYRVIRFYEAQTFIQFIKEYKEFIGQEKINAVYTFGAQSGSVHFSGRRIFDTDRPLVIEFDTVAVKIDYYFFSDLTINIIDREAFRKGRWSSELLGWFQVPSDPFPYEKAVNMSCLEGHPISEFIVERFSDEFEIDSSTGCSRLAGGDYFASLYLMIGDKGLRICGEDSISDGYMDYEIVSRDNLAGSNHRFSCTYESIRLDL